MGNVFCGLAREAPCPDSLSKLSLRDDVDKTLLLQLVFSNKRKQAGVAFLSPLPVQVRQPP